MPGFEITAGTVTLPAWAAAAAIALFVVIAVFASMRSGASIAAAVLRVTFVLVGCAAVLLLLQQGAVRERSAERRALDQRAAELAARAVGAGSPLACLDAVAGDAVETACEKAVFANPASVASAVSYVTARLALLSDSVDYARRTGSGYESALATLRLSIETDRYGIVAHVLSVRDSCTPLLCDSYVLFKDPDRVQANLRDRLFERYVERYTAEWSRAPAARTAAPVAPPQQIGPPSSTATAPAAAPNAPALR
jgi:signal transduction histidine kinase